MIKKIKLKIKNFAEIINGSTPSTKNKDFWNGSIVWLTPKDLADQKRRIIYKGYRNITELGLKNCSAKILPKGTILLTSRAPIGLIAIAGNELTTNQGFKNLIINNKLVNNNYFYYYLKLKIHDLKRIGGGTTFKEISKEILEEFEVEIPESTDYQQKIASVLSALDEKIELNNKINEELEKMARLLYDYWFVQFDFPDENGRPYKSSGGKMVWNEELKRKIPEGWEVENLLNNSLTKIIKPGINFFEGEKTYIATADLNENQINFFAKKISFDKRETRANMEPKYNSVWFAKMMKTKKTIYFGDYSDFFINQFILSTGFLGLEVKKNYYLEYIWNFINNHEFENIKDKLANGAVQLAINNNSLKFIPLLKPKEKILIKFHKKTRPIYKKIYLNQIENFILIQLRDWLLPMLMNGQVVVR